ncbi:type II secretion system protein GspM [Gammaproteobacteria bacterium]|jgi:type II secretory pathway component PulM|nr:type II secretion system protein M [Gammaproteobacteria bacterium]MDB4850566.1 type II secretion system protein M [Gammaproteobacteria bacterium]MDC0440837.1 type II secretion system protein M [Gammaproteobacteria bacterium]MDC0914237.1 type II secretion system protein GspM [Gammaproteobacteria bacterium]
MKISMLADFWNARERRERFLLLTVLAIFVLVLLGAYFNKAYSSIAYQSKALDRSKNDFYYVFEKANNALTYQNTQQIIKQTSSVEEFISSQAQSSKISNLKIYEDANKKSFSFTQQSIENSAQFLEAIASHPSILIDSIDVEFLENGYEIISVYRSL